MNQEVKNKLGGLSSCECVMYSVNFAEIEKNMRVEKWELVKKDLLQVSKKIKSAGSFNSGL
jgi:aspartate racemase